MKPYPAISDAAIDCVSVRRMLVSLVRRVIGRSKRRYRHGTRFQIERDPRLGRVYVRDLIGGGAIWIDAPLEKDAFTVLEVFTSRAYTLADTSYAVALEAVARDDRPNGPRPLIIDVGANIGASSLLFSMLYPRCRVLALEPDPRNVELLTRNSRSAAVQVIPAAIGVHDGSAMLESGSNPRSSRVTADGTIRVEMVSVPTLLAQAGDCTPLMLKLDIEGAERELFGGDCRWLDRFPIISIEPHDWKWPGCGITQPFLAAMAGRKRDLLVLGENLVSVDGDMLQRVFGVDEGDTRI